MRLDLSARLVWLAVAGLLGGAGAAWIVSNAGPVRTSVPNVPLALPVAVLVGWSLIGGGLLAWRSRPGNRLGAVLIFTAFARFASHCPIRITWSCSRSGKRSTPVKPTFCT